MAVTDTTAWIMRIRQRKDIPDNLKETMIETVVRHRQLLERTLGELELAHLRAAQVGNLDLTPENWRDERVDDAPHARPRQVEGLLDSGMFDFVFAGSNPA